MPFVKTQEKLHWVHKTCYHPEHHPTAYVNLPPGQYTYKCPKCGHEITFRVH